MRFLLAILLSFTGCKNTKNSKPSTPGSTPVAEENLYVCLFTENVNSCSISDYSFRKLIKLSNYGILTSKVLALKEVKEKYHISEDQVQCLKNNFCKEDL